MRNSFKFVFPVVIIILLMIIAAGARPQLSYDEQNAIIDAVVQTMDPERMKAEVIAEVEQNLIAKFNAGGYTGLVAALSLDLPQTPAPTATVPPTPTADPGEILRPTSETAEAAPTLAASGTGEPREYDKAIDYWDGAVLQEDGTYRGLHAKQVSAYAYTLGGDENGQVKEFQTRYTPNVRFNVDVVFENDGSVVWPAHIEMRHVGNVGEYTGHAESVYSDRTNDPVKPGDRCAFTVSAYGSENLGWTTFYFKLFDADSGSVIEGGNGSFTYEAY